MRMVIMSRLLISTASGLPQDHHRGRLRLHLVHDRAAALGVQALHRPALQVAGHEPHAQLLRHGTLLALGSCVSRSLPYRGRGARHED
jgi:hypothetical protein